MPYEIDMLKLSDMLPIYCGKPLSMEIWLYLALYLFQGPVITVGLPFRFIERILGEFVIEIVVFSISWFVFTLGVPEPVVLGFLTV